MRPRRPSSTLFPYTTLFRSPLEFSGLRGKGLGALLKLPFRLFAAGKQAKRQFKQCTQTLDRKSTRLNSSHVAISYAVFCLKKKHHQSAGVFRSSRLQGESRR